MFLLQNCQESYQADCLVPFQSGEPVSIETTKEDADHQVIWFDLYVPSYQPPGLYSGNIEINLNEQSRGILEVKLTVYPFVLPENPLLRADLNNYGVGFTKEWGYKVGSEKWISNFPTLYRLNTKADFYNKAKMTSLKIRKVISLKNPPGYLMWSRLTFYIGLLYDRLITRFKLDWLQPNWIVVYEKTVHYQTKNELVLCIR